MLKLPALLIASAMSASTSTTFTQSAPGALVVHAPVTLVIDGNGTSTTRSSAPAGTKVLVRLRSPNGKVYITVAKQPATFTITADGVWTLDADY